MARNRRLATPQSFRIEFANHERRTEHIKSGIRVLEPTSYAGNELINLNQLIDDVITQLPVPMVGNLMLSSQLAPDMPLVQGDYRVVRRLLLEFLSEINGVISLKTKLVCIDRVELNEIYRSGNAPEGGYVLMELSRPDSDRVAGCISDVAVRRQFLFPCAAMVIQE